MNTSASRLILIAALVLLFISMGLSAVGAASTTYEVSVPDSIDVPDRVVEARGEKLNITSVARVRPGEDIEASTTAPENENYLLMNYNSSGSIVNFESMKGSGSATFSTDDIDSGTYLLILDGDDGRASQPVVVAGYDADLTVPNTAEPGETVNAVVELDPISDDEPAIDSVELAVMTDGEPEQVSAVATDLSGDTYVYEAELTVPNEEDEYDVFASVLGEDSIAGTSEQEMLEITEATIDVSEATTEKDTNEDSTDGGETEGDSGDTSEDVDGTSGSGSATDRSGENATNETDGDGEQIDTNETDTVDNSTDATNENETDDQDADTDGVAGSNSSDSSESASDDEGPDTNESIDSRSSNDESSDSSESTSDNHSSIDPNDTDEDGSVVEEQAPLTGVPHFLTGLLLLSAIARRRRNRE